MGSTLGVCASCLLQMLAPKGQPMRVRCMLRQIQEELGLTVSDLGRELAVDIRTIDKLIADDANWRLDRRALYRYLLFARKHGFDAFRIEPNEIWRSFENSEAIIFRGPKKAVIPVESHLVKYFEQLNCEVISSTATAGIEDAMRQQNCVIIGSPDVNQASECGLALLWKAEPFNGDAENREKIPINFLGMQPERTEPSVLIQESRRHGLQIQLPGSRERSYLKVDWIWSEKYGPHKEIGQDAAVLVVCHQPMGTQKNVTTIVIAGYTDFATLVAAQEVTHKKIPELRPEDTPGQPCLAVLKFHYRKRPQIGRVLNNLHAAEEGSMIWAPPWESFFDASFHDTRMRRLQKK
jgi:hypothetical protein